jgi:transcriptional regulator with XRE-family HTH domain
MSSQPLNKRRGRDPAPARRTFLEELKSLVLRTRRHRGGLKINSLAAKMSISAASLYAYLSGATLLSTERLDDLLGLLDCSPEEAGRLHQLRDEVELNVRRAKSPAGPPIIETRADDGSLELADTIDISEADEGDTDLAGSYEIEELKDTVFINAGRTISRVVCTRLIRALQSGVDNFLYPIECPSNSGLHRVGLLPVGGVAVSQVVRITESAYVFHLRLPRRLDAGDRFELVFDVETSEDDNTEHEGFYGKRQFMTTKRMNLAVMFEAEARPERVRWFASRFPLGEFPDGYSVSDDNEVMQSSPGLYEKEFGDGLTPVERIVGLTWNYL